MLPPTITLGFLKPLTKQPVSHAVEFKLQTPCMCMIIHFHESIKMPLPGRLQTSFFLS